MYINYVHSQNHVFFDVDHRNTMTNRRYPSLLSYRQHYQQLNIFALLHRKPLICFTILLLRPIFLLIPGTSTCTSNSHFQILLGPCMHNCFPIQNLILACSHTNSAFGLLLINRQILRIIFLIQLSEHIICFVGLWHTLLNRLSKPISMSIPLHFLLKFLRTLFR